MLTNPSKPEHGNLTEADLTAKINDAQAILAAHLGPDCCWHAREAKHDLDMWLWLGGDSGVL